MRPPARRFDWPAVLLWLAGGFFVMAAVPNPSSGVVSYVVISTIIAVVTRTAWWRK